MTEGNIPKSSIPGSPPDLDDDQKLYFGGDRQTSMRFDPGVGDNGALVVRDESNDEDRLSVPLNAALAAISHGVDLDGQTLVDGANTVYNPAEGGTVRTNEAVQDIAGGMAGDGLTYDDANDRLEVLPTVGRDPLYGDGSDGSITRSADGTETGLVLATDYTVEAGVTMTVSSGVLVILATGTVTINGTLDASGQGGAGGDRGEGTDDGSAGSPARLLPRSAGGAGGSGTTGGGDGAAGGDGDTGSPPLADFAPALPRTLLAEVITSGGQTGAGGGGGGGGFGNSATTGAGHGAAGSPPGGGGEGGGTPEGLSSGNGGAGGNGGGLVIIIAHDGLSGSGSILARGLDGGDGGDAEGAGGGGGGGGSGGVIYLGSAILSTGNLLTDVSRGVGGTGGQASAEGGDGAPGETGVVIEES